MVLLIESHKIFNCKKVLYSLCRAGLHVRIGSTLSDWLTLKGGVPQGTKLGVILFTVMTNRLLSDWWLCIKYVDDTSALKIIPRNSPSLLNVVASDIHNLACRHGISPLMFNFISYSFTVLTH